MLKSIKPLHLVLAALCAALMGCASVTPVAYSGLASAPYLRPNSQDDSGRVPYRFAPQTEWQKYTKLIIDPVTIYQGADNQFGDMQDADKAGPAGMVLGWRFT